MDYNVGTGGEGAIMRASGGGMKGALAIRQVGQMSQGLFDDGETKERTSISGAIGQLGIDATIMDYLTSLTFQAAAAHGTTRAELLKGLEQALGECVPASSAWYGHTDQMALAVLHEAVQLQGRLELELQLEAKAANKLDNAVSKFNSIAKNGSNATSSDAQVMKLREALNNAENRAQQSESFAFKAREEVKMVMEAAKKVQEDMKQAVARAERAEAALKSSPATKAGPSPETEEEVRRLKAELAARQADVERLRKELDVAQSSSSSRLSQLQKDVQRAESEANDARAEAARLKERVRALESMEERFTKLRDDNRKLYNTIQDLRGAIRVFCRIRPLGQTGDKSSKSCIDFDPDENEIIVIDGEGGKEPKAFKFDKIYGGGTTQKEIYDDAAPLIRSVLDGYNVCIFAYGQTGSGKTHTMLGSNVSQESGRGINYRGLQDLFDIINERKADMEYVVKVQMLEVYNDGLRDLLGPQDSSAPELTLLNTMPMGSNVKNAAQIPVFNRDQVLEIMAKGAENRRTTATAMNDRSSRSHVILTVISDGTNKKNKLTTRACLNLIDLAGSERPSKSLVTGAAFDEAVKINASLSALGDVMAALATNSKGGGKEGHIPYRNSKLTQLLADVLGGQSKVMMFMHVAPEDKSMAESISTLQFGAKVASVTLGAAKKNAAGKGAPQAAPVDDGALKEKESQLRDLAKKLDAEKSAREALEAELQKTQSKASASDDRQLRLTQKELEDATRRLEMEKNQKEMLRAELDKVKKNLKAAISGGKRLYKVSSSVASSRGSFGGGNL